MTVKASYEEKQASPELPIWLKKQLTPEELSQLNEKGMTPFIEKVITPEGQIFSGKIQLKQNQQDFELHFHSKKAKLEIPKSIDNEELNPDQVNDLKLGKIIKLKNGYIQIDQELNKVLIHSGRDLSVLSEIGGVKLTPKEQERYANGQPITKVMKTDKFDSYMIGTFKKGPNGAIEWDMNQTKMIEPHEYEKYNIDQLKITFNSVDKKLNQEKLMYEFLHGNDKVLPEIERLKTSGFSPTIEQIERNAKEAPKDRKNALLSSFGLDSNTYDRFKQCVEEKEIHKGLDQTKYKITHYNLTEKTITLQTENGVPVTTNLTSEIRTQKEFEHFQEMSRGKGMGKSTSMKI